ncbi:GNAT family N-acetyltransferase [Euzebyella marina]|uniref:GNAT family N-acetyltransferase n=1 Tax=Euzebyella marina TaxID=1761453 RepID=A0A3G2L698_9FLAO|nr:GNAT family N-acetyltransferase [Euzebyella marina]AYN67780.1 GNAT family N-acetyltransferase [Euzebyella marina]
MNIRKAELNDLSEIVALLANDPLGRLRENFEKPLPKYYVKAFEVIEKDPHQFLMVLENVDSSILGTFQLSFIQYLTYRGGIRCQIEAVRIHQDHRGRGLGKYMFDWVIEFAKEKGAHVVQLTSDKNRTEALEFYKQLGFMASHEGMKLHL